MPDWETTFAYWAEPLSNTEAAQCDNAERAIRRAIDASPALGRRSITVFAQGSYRNNTNVRMDSDVDICVRCRDTFFYDTEYAGALTAVDLGIGPATYLFGTFKQELHQALTSYFGAGNITRGDKAFDVHANTYRVDADVVPAFEYRQYNQSGGFTEGVAFNTDTGRRIVNYPEQHYRNGVSKNEATGRLYKRLVRIFKRLRNQMNDEGVPAAGPISSYLIECLIYGVPNSAIGYPTFTRDVQECFSYLRSALGRDFNYEGWREVNDIKYLWHPNQPWNLGNAQTFLAAAQSYVGL